MIFPEKVLGIKKQDRVLEVGPGSSPYFRSDVFLEMKFQDEELAKIHRSFNPPLVTDKPVVYYDGRKFPFEDMAFDYVICSHVLEHVEDMDLFISELCRVAPKGYVEFPTIYYDYLYGTPGHVNYLLYKNEILNYMKIDETPINFFSGVQDFFLKCLNSGYSGDMKYLKDQYFQGYVWNGSLPYRKASRLTDVLFDENNAALRPNPRRRRRNLFEKIKYYVAGK